MTRKPRQIVTFVNGNNEVYPGMIRKIKELYKEFKPYVRVDLIMYGVMVLLIILYFIISIFI